MTKPPIIKDPLLFHSNRCNKHAKQNPHERVWVLCNELQKPRLTFPEEYLHKTHTVYVCPSCQNSAVNSLCWEHEWESCAFQHCVTSSSQESVWAFVILKDLVLMKETAAFVA